MPYTVEIPGGRGIVEVADDVPLEEARLQIEKQFPPNGAEIAERLAAEPDYQPTTEEFQLYKDYAKEKQTSFIDSFAQGVEYMLGVAGRGIAAGVTEGAALNPANYLEAMGQGTQQLYGMIAQSQDPNSALFKLKDLINGTGTIESQRQQFIEARKFNQDLAKYESGESTFLPKEMVNPEYVQAAAMILDPTLALPGLGEVFGAGKLATKGVGLAARGVGRGVSALARPVETATKAGERILAEAINVTPEGLATAARTTGVASALGVAPAVGVVGAVPLIATTAREAGEALATAGENLISQPSRIGPLEAIGRIPGANLRQRTLGVIGQYGGDAALDMALRATAGSIEGGAIGAGLGYLGGGEEGAGFGAGSGATMGAAGTAAARGYQKLTGKAAREARQGDFDRYVATQDENTAGLLRQIESQHGLDVASGFMDATALVRGQLGDVNVTLLSAEDYRKRFGTNTRGVQIPEADTPAIYVNADLFGEGKGDSPLYTLGHELFHALERSEQLSSRASDIKDALVGSYVVTDGVATKVTNGLFDDAEVNRRFNEYRDKLAPQQAESLAAYDTPQKRADFVASEIAAEYTGALFAGQKPDALLRGFSGLTRTLLDQALTKNADSALNRIAQRIENTFGLKPLDSILFPDLKQASPQVNAMLRDLVRARRKLDERILAADSELTGAIKPSDMGNPIAAKVAQDFGIAEQNPDGTTRWLTDEEINAREWRDNQAVQDILLTRPGARLVDGVIQGRFSPEQLSAIEQSQQVSSRMKDKIRAVAASITNGNSIFIDYNAATRRVKNKITGKHTSKYSSGIRMTQRELLPYAFYFSKADNPVIKAIDLTKVRRAVEGYVRKDGSVDGIWENMDGFMSDLAKYFTNLDSPRRQPSAVALDSDAKAKFMGDLVNEMEKDGRKFVRDFRLDRMGAVSPRNFRARISEEAIKFSKMRWMPGENVGDTKVTGSEEGYRIVSKDKNRLYGPDGKLIGIYDTQLEAERKADATQARVQSEIDQQQRLEGDEGRQTAEAGGGDRPVSSTKGQEESGKEGDVVQYTKEERAALSEAKKRISRNLKEYPEAVPLSMQVDSKTGRVKFDQLEGPDGQPILDAKGRPVVDVVFKKVPYEIRNSPKLSKDNAKAVTQAADLLEADARKAINMPSVSNGLGWYSRMREFLQTAFGASIELFGQLLGATSARTPVDTNFRQALEAIRMFSAGNYDSLLNDFDAHVKKANADAQSGELLRRWKEKNPGKRESMFKVQDELRKEINRFDQVPLRENGKKFNANSQKVLHVLYGLWLDQTVGPKTPNFAGNLTGRTLKATIDVWAARNLRRLLYEGKAKRWRILPEQESGVTDPDFFFAQDVYDTVAKRLGMNADDLQALMWFMEKDVWEKNGWTSTVGAEKSSFDKEAGKLALDRYQAGVTTFTTPEQYSPEIQEKERMALRNSIAKIPGMTSSRVTHSDGMYGDYIEPSFDVEFSVQRKPDGSSQDISSQVAEIIRIASEQGRKQNDVFVSKVVDQNHPNARPMVEIGFKKAASPEDVQAVVQAFRSNGIDGFTIAKDTRGKVIGIRAQYIPEISARFDTIEHLDPDKSIDFATEWMNKTRNAALSLDQIENVSYKQPGWVSTTVYGIEEYSSATPSDNGRTSRRNELDRRRAVLEARQVPSGPAPNEGMEPGTPGLPASGGDVSAAVVQPQSAEIAGARLMPSDREVTRSVNINDSSQDFTGQILRGEKTIETRDTLNNALQGVLGQRIGITRTGTGDTKVVGYATVAKQPIVYQNESEFRRDEGRHQVSAGSPYDIKKGGLKYGYELTDVVAVEPFAPKSVGRKYSMIEAQKYMPAPVPDPSIPGAYSMSGYRILPGKTKGRVRVYSPTGGLLGIASSNDEAQRMIQRKLR